MIDRYFLKYERYNPSHLFPGVDPTLRGAQGLVNSESLPGSKLM